MALACGETPAETSPSNRELPLAEEPLREGTSALRVGRIYLSEYDSAIVETPSAARRGEPVNVSVTTYGGGCVSADTTVATVSGLRAVVVPYQRQYQPPASGACTLALRIERRTVPLIFATSGIAVVRVVGRSSRDDELIAVERRLTVQ